MKKSFKISIAVKNCDLVFNPKLGPGVIGAIIVDFNNLKPKDLRSPFLAKELMDHGETFLNSLIEKTIEELP